MPLWVTEDVDDIISNDYQCNDTDNSILEHSDEALALIGKIIGIHKDSYRTQYKIHQLDELIGKDLLSSFKKVQLNDEAHLQMELDELGDKLNEQKKFAILKDHATIGIGGKFSAGKSRFINSLLNEQEELLPEDLNPTTSIPTYLVGGEEDEIKALTKDGYEVQLSKKEMQALTHKFYEKYKMGFASFIDSLIISRKNMPFQYSNLVFLDTPGYSKADDFGNGKNIKGLSDKNKALEQLRSVDYLIWLLDIQNGTLNVSDIDFIKEIGSTVPLLIVANKCDKKIDQEISGILDEIENVAKTAGINIFGVTAYSSVKNMEWNGRNQIEVFLNQAAKNPVSKDSLSRKIQYLNKNILSELDKKKTISLNEKSDLREIIYRTDSVLEMKALVSLYSDIVNSIQSIYSCQKEYLRKFSNIEKLFRQLYSGVKR